MSIIIRPKTRISVAVISAAVAVLMFGACGGSAARNDFTEAVNVESSPAAAVVQGGDWVLEATNLASASEAQSPVCLRIRIATRATSCYSTQLDVGASMISDVLTDGQRRRFVIIASASLEPLKLRTFSSASSGATQILNTVAADGPVQAGVVELADGEALWGVQLVDASGSVLLVQAATG